MTLARPGRPLPDLPPGWAVSLLLLALGLGLVWSVDPGPSAKAGSSFVAAWTWSGFMLGAAWLGWRPRITRSGMAFALLALVVAAQCALGQLAYPDSGWMAVALLLGAAAVAGLGHELATRRDWIEWAAWGLLLQALVQVGIGVSQFAMWQMQPLSQWLSAHAPWIYNVVSYPGNGRVYGNLRQPNHYASAVALGYVGLAVLAPRWRARWTWLLSALLGWALVVCGSRTGAVHAGVVAIGVLLCCRRPWRDARMGALLAAPLLYLGWWELMHVADRLGWIGYLDALSRQLDQPVNARAVIWRDAWEVFRMRPWFGWGWGQIGWGLEQTSMAGRLHPLPLENIDNAHDLVLQLLAETGLVGTLLVALPALAWLWRVSAPWRGAVDDAPRARRALLAPLIGCAVLALHSLLEYPLWYPYFLLDFAFLLGWAEAAMLAGTPAAAREDATAAGGGARAAALAGALLALALVAKAQLDYVRTGVMFAADAASGAELRAQALRDDWFFLALAQFPDAADVLPAPGDDPPRLRDELALLERSSHVWGDPSLLSRRMIVLLRLGRREEALRLAQYTAHAFWMYAPQTARAFGPLAAAAGLGGDADARRVVEILRAAPVLRRIEVPAQ